MSFEITASDNFVKELKKLAKKYASLRNEISVLGEELSANPMQGTAIGKDFIKSD